MLRITLRFPLGMYCAQSAGSPKEPEWPPSPLRLIGALLAAAHGRHGVDPAPDRALIERLCSAEPPTIGAPESAPLGAPAADERVARLRGATRWAPRNYLTGPISPRDLGRGRAEVSKAGVAVGDHPVHMIWDEVELDAGELERLAALASDVTFLGTTRSPVIAEVAAGPPAERDGLPVPLWTRAPAGGAAAVPVRVPDERAIAAFDRRETARRSDRGRLQPGRMVPQISIGSVEQYAPAGSDDDPFDPTWWGEWIVLALDGSRSDVRPKAPAAYLLARAARLALLGTYGDAGTSDEAPAILTARGSDPHCAIVPLPNVWGPHAGGGLLGVAVVLPHASRVPDLAAQRYRVEAGLRRLVDDPSRFVQIPGAGRVQLAVPDRQAAQTTTLRAASYRGPSASWVSVTPVVHSRWRKGGMDGLHRQVTADCAHVGLPEPACVKLLRGAGRPGGAARTVPLEHVPDRWRGPLQGPADHLRITFARPVHGPVLLGRARHFGLGLCVPAAVDASAAAAERAA